MRKRVRALNQVKQVASKGPVVYWMQREMRVEDNWALLFAQDLAQKNKVPLWIIFALRTDLTTHFGTRRMLDFMLTGLAQVEEVANKHGIGFQLLLLDPVKAIKDFIKLKQAAVLVTDFSPLKTPRNWKTQIAHDVNIPFYEVDAHNIIPCWQLSDKQEFAAYTIRPKVHKLLNEYLTDYPTVQTMKSKVNSTQTDWAKVGKKIKVIEHIDHTPIKPGELEAQKALTDFLDHILDKYTKTRNDPSLDGVSNLSPYLHFGQFSAQRVALEVSKWQGAAREKEAFLEELIVRRELAENYCFYNPDYKSFAGFPDWAKKTLDDHRQDVREFNYSLQQLEQANTHDEAWNAAQKQMVITGKMHGYMRMYWAKKILEWTSSPEEAQEIAIYLNDLYELDGRDPNGYTGIAWSIGGVHDRAWFERPVFSKVRYMNLNGLKRKFDVEGYVKKISAVNVC